MTNQIDTNRKEVLTKEIISTLFFGNQNLKIICSTVDETHKVIEDLKDILENNFLMISEDYTVADDGNQKIFHFVNGSSMTITNANEGVYRGKRAEMNLYDGYRNGEIL